MKIFNALTLLLLLLGLTITACKEEAPTTQEEESTIDLTSLTGEWIIETVEKEGETVNSLNGGVFNFVDDKTLVVGANLPGVSIDEPTAYELDGESIKNVGSMKLNFDIKSLDAKKMVLSSRIQGLEFSFKLNRVE